MAGSPPYQYPSADAQAVPDAAVRQQARACGAMHRMRKMDKEVVETLLDAVILSLAHSRRLLAAIRNALPQHAERLKEQRFANLFPCSPVTCWPWSSGRRSMRRT